MKLVEKETSLVVTGAWNAAIVTPEWLLRYGLQKAEGVEAQVQVQIPTGQGMVFEFPRYTFEDITIQIRPDALVIRPHEASQPSLDKLAWLAVASRTIIRTLIEEVWMGSVPIFHRLHRRLAFQC
jgi:hypothetical protein